MNANNLLVNHTFFSNHHCSSGKNMSFQNSPISISWKRNVPTCSLTEARMAEVVSVSEPSPLEVVRPGLRELLFSAADEGWSGTGIAPAKQGDTLNAIWCCHWQQTHLSGNFNPYTLAKWKLWNAVKAHNIGETSEWSDFSYRNPNRIP